MAEASGSRVGQDDETGPFGYDYDVFLSFRGPDTRLGITDVLYEFMTGQGIRVFRDDEEIRRGEEIGGELKRAIHCSRVYVVVFSRGYASSAWCLQELAMMVDCCRDSVSGKVILPIFFDVDPQDIKLRTDLYRGALDKHRGRSGEERVKRWEEALVKVGGISGWDYKGDMGEGKFARLVVQNVLKSLQIKDRSLPPYLIGMDDRVETVMNMLNCESPDVRVVTLHGMGGIGKTTLANAIFNKISSQFDGCCFLANMRESSTSEGGVIQLQKKLLVDILGCSDMGISDSNDGRNQIDRRLRGKKVLLVFDDVSERRQLQELVRNCGLFELGTRVIVTTRDSNVCKGLLRSSDIYTFEMEGMSDDHALQLLSHLAFGGKGPPGDFVALSRQVIRTTGNLPLALEVIGGHLSGEDKDVWESTLEKLERVPNKDVMKILRISYDGLEESEKQIFLDIACFDHYVMTRKYASYMWEACDFHPKSELNVLQNKSLIKVLNVRDDDKYNFRRHKGKHWTHDLIRDKGRRRDKFWMDDLTAEKGRKREKYWMHDLIREMGREIVRSESLLLHSPGICSRLWDWKEARDVVRQKQGIHHVSAIDLGSFWNQHSLNGEELECMSNLRFLYLAGGQLTGEFRNFRTKLLWLHWNLLWKLGSNPAFFKMDNLVILEISGKGITDDSMKDLRMGKLRVLDIRFAKIRRMPDLCRCSKLEMIIFRACEKLEELNSSIGGLRHLKFLKIKGCMHLRRLPEELGSAKALQELVFINCDQIRELPESIGNLGNLKILCGIRIEISKLPSSIRNLKSLEVLQIKGSCSCEARVQLCSAASHYFMGAEVSQLDDFQELDNDMFPGLKPSSEVPNLGSCNLSGLSCLRSLTLFCLDKLGELQELPSSLTKLSVVHCPRQLFSNLASLTNLTELELDGASDHLLGIEKLPRLQKLKLDVGDKPVPLSTELGSLSRLEELHLTSSDISSISQLPSSLRELTLVGFRTEVQWERYSNLQFLHRLVLSCSWLSQIRLEGLRNMGKLSHLEINECYGLEKLGDLGCLRRACSLHVSNCPKLMDISGVEGMELLEELVIEGCGDLSTIPDLWDLRRLKKVEFGRCYSLESLPGVAEGCRLKSSYKVRPEIRGKE